MAGIIWTNREPENIKKVYFNDKTVSKVYFNDSLIANLPIGNLTMYLQWRYSDEESGSGCDLSTYYYPDDLKLIISTTNFSSLNKYTIKWEIAYQNSDCYKITKTSNTGVYGNNTQTSETLTGTKSWSNADSGYLNVIFNIKIYDDANNLIATLDPKLQSLKVTADWSNWYIYNGTEITAN